MLFFLQVAEVSSTEPTHPPTPVQFSHGFQRLRAAVRLLVELTAVLDDGLCIRGIFPTIKSRFIDCSYYKIPFYVGRQKGMTEALRFPPDCR